MEDPEVFCHDITARISIDRITSKGIASLGDLKEALASGQDPDQLAKNSRLTPLAIDYLQDLRRPVTLERGGIMNEMP